MNKKTFLLATAALSVVAAVQADTSVYITGATAFRAVAFQAIQSMFTGTPTVVGGAGDTQQTFQGTVSGLSGTTTVYCSYNGSIDGVSALVNPSTLLTFKNVGSGTTTHAADLSFTDISPLNAPFPVSGVDAVDVGIVPFVWVKNAHANAAPITDITTKVAKSLMGSYTLPAYVFTGNPANTADVGIVGRAWTSGTRGLTALEMEYGLLNAANFVVNNAGTAELADGLNSGDNNLYAVGFGYQSGSNLRKALRNTCDTALVGMMSYGEYVAIPTGQTAFPVGSILTFNGVTFNRQNVTTGKYTFFATEKLAHKTAAYAGSAVEAWVNKFTPVLDTQLATDVSATPEGIPLSQMHVSRNADGGPLAPK